MLVMSQGASSQQYHPGWIVSSLVGTSILASQAPAEQMRNTRVYGWLPSQDVTPAQYDPPNAAQRRCYGYLKQAGITPSSPADYSYSQSICEALFAYEAALGKSAGVLDGTAVIRGLEQLGTTFQSVFDLGGAARFSTLRGATTCLGSTAKRPSRTAAPASPTAAAPTRCPDASSPPAVGRRASARRCWCTAPPTTTPPGTRSRPTSPRRDSGSLHPTCAATAAAHAATATPRRLRRRSPRHHPDRRGCHPGALPRRPRRHLAARALASKSLVYVDPPWRTSLPAADQAVEVENWSAADRAVDAASTLRADPALADWIPTRLLAEVPTAIRQDSADPCAGAASWQPRRAHCA